jgi:large subunit ribosomal protein L21
MYAVIKTGGKQHKVKPGDVIEVELIRSDGETVTFTPLLVVDDDGATHFGKEASKAVVTAKLVGEQKGDKVKIFKYRPKTGYAKRAGHRQMYTLIEIQDVTLGGTTKRAAKAAPKQEAKADAEEPKAEAQEPKAEAQEPQAEAQEPEAQVEEPKAQAAQASEPDASPDEAADGGPEA